MVVEGVIQLRTGTKLIDYSVCTNIDAFTGTAADDVVAACAAVR